MAFSPSIILYLLFTTYLWLELRAAGPDSSTPVLLRFGLLSRTVDLCVAELFLYNKVSKTVLLLYCESQTEEQLYLENT